MQKTAADTSGNSGLLTNPMMAWSWEYCSVQTYEYLKEDTRDEGSPLANL